MLIPRFNRFKIQLPTTIIPHWVHDLFVDILADANLLKVYASEPINCIAESLCGINMPGLHLKLIEQQHQDAAKRGSYTTYYPKGENAMKVIDDNELSLQFRLVDGFHNYNMVKQAVAYMANDNAQSMQGETYKQLGSISVEFELSPNYKQVTTYKHCVYSTLSDISVRFSQKAEESSFTVRIKFVEIEESFYYKGQCISSRAYNHNIGN